MHIHILHALNRVTQSIIQPTTENMEDNNHRASSSTNIAQAMGPRSGEKGLSLKLQALA